ncbi:pentapeptide repeat-containing protein [Embleya sp. AB8]|uniref:pentapeptide repeat-containing protein n=1 Tax=Embleya sp. AB8 TaxID=3156304 RepID=UPI003C77DE43
MSSAAAERVLELHRADMTAAHAVVAGPIDRDGGAGAGARDGGRYRVGGVSGDERGRAGTSGDVGVGVLNGGMAIRPARANIDPVSPEPPIPDEGLVIRDEDWYGKELTDTAKYTRYSFLDTDWTEVVNEGAVFDECTFAGVRFNASRHTGAAFTNCTFKRCTFFDTRFTDCKLVGSLFQQCTYTLFEVSGGDWSFVGLPGADLRQVTFDGTRMREVDLTAARLEQATVTGCDLSGAMLHGAKLIGADLRGSELSSLDPLTVEFKGATITLEQAATIATTMGWNVG